MAQQRALAPFDIRFPKPLGAGDLVAVSAPSSGVAPRLHARLDLVLAHLRACGFRVVEGACLRAEQQQQSAPREQRAHELMRLLRDPEIAAVMPPWGGERAIELLPLLDFDALRALPPKWLIGYSDTSTLQMPLTLLSRWATAHGPTLMDLAPTQSDPLTTGALAVLGSAPRTPVPQRSSSAYQRAWRDFAIDPATAFQLTEPTRWRRLDGSDARIVRRGRLIGGCIDTLSRLAGTRFGDVPRFVRDAGRDGAILYLENAEARPCELLRTLLSLRLSGWFDGLSALLLGRSDAPDANSADDLDYLGALRAALGDLEFPVIFDTDIGHRPPQMMLVNGALAEVEFERGRSSVTQWFA